MIFDENGKMPAFMQQALINVLKQIAPDLPQQLDDMAKKVAGFDAKLNDIGAKLDRLLNLNAGANDHDRPDQRGREPEPGANDRTGIS